MKTYKSKYGIGEEVLVDITTHETHECDCCGSEYDKSFKEEVIAKILDVTFDSGGVFYTLKILNNSMHNCKYRFLEKDIKGLHIKNESK